jgi:hypothetical protein
MVVAWNTGTVYVLIVHCTILVQLARYADTCELDVMRSSKASARFGAHSPDCSVQRRGVRVGCQSLQDSHKSCNCDHALGDKSEPLEPRQSKCPSSAASRPQHLHRLIPSVFRNSFRKLRMLTYSGSFLVLCSRGALAQPFKHRKLPPLGAAAS